MQTLSKTDAEYMADDFEWLLETASPHIGPEQTTMMRDWIRMLREHAEALRG